MKKLLAAVWPLMLSLGLWAAGPAINDIDIRVTLTPDGGARIEEVWDVVVASGTEWYLVRGHLGDIVISNLSVRDESGRSYVNEGSWDVDRSLEQKAGRCGLHDTGSGYEICWGVGSYGPHTFTVGYDMSNAVKSLNDYDMLHIQFISDQLSSSPAHARLRLTAPVPLSEENSRIWAFGYVGSISWQKDGSVLAETDSALGYDDSMILLLRFDKGIFSSGSVQERDFEDVLSKAQEGSYYPDEEEDPWYVTVFAVLIVFGMFWLFIIKPIKWFLSFFGIGSKGDKRRRIKEIFGVKSLPVSPEWSRDLPFDGNIFETYYIASHLKGIDDGSYTVVSAMMLRMMMNHVIEMRADSKGKNEFYFNSAASKGYMSGPERQLLSMLAESSGSDGVLQEKEFSKWADSHRSRVMSFVESIKDWVISEFRSGGMLESARSYGNIILNELGRTKALKALSFKQFLNDFTLVSERYSVEVALWENYLVMAAVFGLAAKVAKEMNAMAPNFKSFSSVPIAQFSDIVMFSDSLGKVARNAYIRATTPVSSGSYSGGSSSSSRGYGGHSSHSGGGGFSGGGHGGGSR